jgi:hypothetical protein
MIGLDFLQVTAVLRQNSARRASGWSVGSNPDRLTQPFSELGLDGIVAELNPGGRIPLELESRSLRLLTHEVMPAFK